MQAERSHECDGVPGDGPEGMANTKDDLSYLAVPLQLCEAHLHFSSSSLFMLF